ncbi:hypothetical protein C8R48DRAFT_720828 [Suillus tomentosus]|nr:hypothetical protein C8R48DRAFT_720828 [Suillus tomentosus]
MVRSGQRRSMENGEPSNGTSFVGTRGSTICTLASRRVRSWHDGATRLIRWEWPGADDH